MATWDDVRRMALSMPDSGERFVHGSQGWHVHNQGFVWERPLRKADLRALGDMAPAGPIPRRPSRAPRRLGRSDHRRPNIDFTTPHFDGHPSVLVWLEQIPLDELQELIVEAWLARAPKRLARDSITARLSDAE